jgi:hypothetical protein
VNGTVVRVIEYALDGLPDAEPSYRLVTHWRGIDTAPATELAALYHRRWTIEQAFDELKTRLATRAVTLRSKRPELVELVEQEFHALLLAHTAIRKLMSQAAQSTQQAAEDLSFVHALRVIKRRLPASAALPPPEYRPTWFDSLLREIASGHVVSSRGKRNPRGVKRKMSNFKLRKRKHPLNQLCRPIIRIFSK